MTALHTQGYVHIPQAVSLTARTLASLRARAARATPIFNYNEHGGTDDDSRFQRHFGPGETRGLAAMQRRVWEVLTAASIVQDAIHRIDEWVVLVSRAPCQHQNRHHDYDPDVIAALADGDVPLAVVVGLDYANTTLDVWPGCIRGKTPEYEAQATQVRIGPGDLVVFRGDLVHAGSSYDEDNVRVHAYIDTPTVRRQRDSTYLIGYTK